MTNQIAFQSEQYWRNVPDGNYCAFDRIGTIPSLFNDIARQLNADFEAEFGDILAAHTMEAYDSVYLMADAMARAGSFSEPDAIVAALETTDMTLSQGRYYFTYGNHNPDMPPGAPAFCGGNGPILW